MMLRPCSDPERGLLMASGLVMQRFDNVDLGYLWQHNARADWPDLVVILEADPEVIAERLAERGPHNRFQFTPGGSPRPHQRRGRCAPDERTESPRER
jgi:hypothetical protein